MGETTVHWRRGELRDDGNGGWWRELADAGALPRGPRTVVHLPARLRTPVVVATMQSLVRFLRRDHARAVAVIARGFGADACAGAELLPYSIVGASLVESPRLWPGTPIADVWFEPVSLITIAGAGPDPRYRIAGVLAANAELLSSAAGLDLDLALEAHRLLAPDLAIACGSVGGDTWQAASTSDVGLDRALARAAGIDPSTLPIVRHLRSHEVLEPGERDAGDPIPRLAGLAAPAWRVRVSRAGARAAHTCDVATTDLRTSIANLRRIPQFVARRSPPWLRLRGAGA